MIVFKICVISVVSDEIISYLVLEISVVSVVTGEVIFYVLYVVSKVSVGIIFHVVLNISVDSAVSDSL